MSDPGSGSVTAVTGPAAPDIQVLSERVKVLEQSLRDKVNSIHESEGALKNRIRELEVSEGRLQRKVDDLTAMSTLHYPSMQRQRLDERLHSLREEVRTMSQDKQRGERVWRDRLQRSQAQLRAKEEELARQSQYFEHFKAQLQQKLSLSRDREQGLAARLHLLERRLLELTASAAAGATATRGRPDPERPTHLRGEGEGEEERKRRFGPLREGGEEEEEDEGGMKGGGGEEEGAEGEKEESGGEARLRGFIMSLQEDLRELLEREERGVAERRGLAEQLQEAQENGHFLSCKVEEMRAAVHGLRMVESSLTEEVEELQEENLRLLRGRTPGQTPGSPASTDTDPRPNPNPAAPHSTPPAAGPPGPGPLDGSDQARLDLQLSAPPSPRHRVAADRSQTDRAEEAKPDNSTLTLPKPDLLNLSGHRSPTPSSGLFSLVTETTEVGEFSLSLADWSLEEEEGGGRSEETEALMEAYRSLGGRPGGRSDQLETSLRLAQEQLQRLSLENAGLKLQLRERSGQGSSTGGASASANQGTDWAPGSNIPTPEDGGGDSDPPCSSPTPRGDELALALNQENRALAGRIRELLAHLELREGEAEREAARLRLRVSGLEEDGARLEQENREQACLVAELTRKTEDDLNAIMELRQRLADRKLESGGGRAGPWGDRATGSACGLSQGDHEIESASRRRVGDDAVVPAYVRPQVDRTVVSAYVQQFEPDGGFVKNSPRCDRDSESICGRLAERPTSEQQCGRRPDDRTVASSESRRSQVDRAVGTEDAASPDVEAEQEELLRSLSVLRDERRDLALSLHGQTEEKHQLTRSLWALKEERDQVSRSLQALKQERDGLTRSLCGAREERRKLTQSMGGLQEERDQLSRSVGSLKEERDLALSGQKEREHIKRSLHGLQQERDQVERSLRSLKEERDQISRSMCHLEDERDKLALSVRHGTEKKDQLADSLCGLGERRDQLQAGVPAAIQIAPLSEGRGLSQAPYQGEGEESGRTEEEEEERSELMREVEAMGVDLRVSREELEKSQSEAQRWHHELGVSEDKRLEAERRATQATDEVQRMREGAEEEEEERRKENDTLRKEVGDVRSRVVRLEREKRDVLSLKTQTEEQLQVLQAQLKAKTVALEELNSEYTALRREQGSRQEERDAFTSLRARYDDIRTKYDVLLRKKSQTDLDMAPLKAKLSCLVAKCQRRNGVLLQMMQAVRGSGCLDLSLALEAEDLLSDAALRDYGVAFAPGRLSAAPDYVTAYASTVLLDSASVPRPQSAAGAAPTERSGALAAFSVTQAPSPAVSQSSSDKDSRPTPNTPLTHTPAVSPVQVPAVPDRCGMYQAEVRVESGPVPVSLSQENGQPPSSPGEWEVLSRTLSSPEKIVNLQQQLQKTLSHSYQALERRAEAGEAESRAGGRGRGPSQPPPQSWRPVHTSTTPTIAPSGPVPAHTPSTKAPSKTAPSRTATITPSLTAAPSGVEHSPGRNTPAAIAMTMTPATGVPGALAGPAPSSAKHAPTATTNSAAPGSSTGLVGLVPLTRMAQAVSTRASAISFKTASSRTALGTNYPPRNTGPPKVVISMSSASTTTPALSRTAPASDTAMTAHPPVGARSPGREGGVGHPPGRASANRPKQEAPAEVGSVDVIRAVGQSSLMIGWERPLLDELGCSNGTFVYGYRVYVDGDFHKSVMSSACTKCILENLDLCGPVNISVQTLGSNGLYAAKVSTLYRGDHAPFRTDSTSFRSGHTPSRTDHTPFRIDYTQLRTDSVSSDLSWTPPTHKRSGSNQSILRGDHQLKNLHPGSEAKPGMFVAIYSYRPLRDSPNLHPSGELALREGDAVMLLSNPRHDGFCEAKVNGRRGLVPIAFLEEVPVLERCGSPAPPSSPPERGPADWST